VAELVGTFLFFFVGIGAIVSLERATASGNNLDLAAGLIIVALAHGVALAVLASALGAVSGAHFNPAVTFAMWIGNKMPWHRAAAYVVAQLIGGILAAAAVQYIFQANVTDLGLPALAQNFSAGSGFLVEMILTVLLVTAVFGTAVDPRGPKLGGLAIGFAVAADILMGGPLTGAAMNPARWFGPAAVTGIFDSSWYVWVVGPLVGAGLVALAYRFLFMPAAMPPKDTAA
jgi:aquaporin Z